jgi:hypothetical protein
MKRRVAHISEREAMKLPRRNFLHLAAGAAALPAMSRVARAQGYPSRPMRIIVGFPAGGAPRACSVNGCPSGSASRRHREPGRCGQQYHHRGSRACGPGRLYVLAGVYRQRDQRNIKLNYNFVGDIAPVASINRVALVMEVNPSLPAKTVAEFIAYAKANPGKISYVSGGVGTTSHLSAELFKMMAGVDFLHVPYRGAAPALTI